jgi:WD40 repeat protein
VSTSLDGRYLFSAGGDQTGRIWDAATGELVALLKHSEVLSRGWFSPDSRTLMTVESGGAVRRWSLAVDDRPDDDWVAIAELLAGKVASVGADTARDDRSGRSATWERLRAAYPEEFAISAADEENWSRQSSVDSANREPSAVRP